MTATSVLILVKLKGTTSPQSNSSQILGSETFNIKINSNSVIWKRDSIMAAKVIQLDDDLVKVKT